MGEDATTKAIPGLEDDDVEVKRGAKELLGCGEASYAGADNDDAAWWGDGGRMRGERARWHLKGFADGRRPMRSTAWEEGKGSWRGNC